MRFFILILLLLSLVPSVVSAETWKVFVHPNCHTASTVAWVNPKYLESDAFKIGVRETSKALQQYCNLELQLVNRWQDADIYVTAHHPDSYRPMWNSRDGHVAGLYVYYRPDYIVISTGWLPARTIDGNRGYWYNFVSTQKSLTGLICHELGHHQSIIGPSHKYNLSSIFATPPRGLIDILERRFGKPTRARMMAEELQGEPWFPNTEKE